MQTSATDLADALRKAKPAPMSYPRPKTSAPSHPQDEAESPSDQESATRRSDARSGEEPSLAPERVTAASPGTYWILTLFIVDGSEFSFTCEATLLGRGELLTAGHCVYQHDPNGDGSSRDARWAKQAWVWPVGRQPSAVLSVSRLAAHQEWITRSAIDHDVGVVTVPALSPAPGSKSSDP